MLLARMGKTRADISRTSTLGQKLRGGRAVANTAEISRIADIPRRIWQEDPTLDELVSLMSAYLRKPGSTATLFPQQAILLQELHDYRGGLGWLGVGAGKTACSFLAPTMLESKRPLLLLPSKLIKEKTRGELAAYRKDWRIPDIRLMSYESLSTRHGEARLRAYDPDLIVGDECFSGDTLIATPSGPRCIHALRPGELVLTPAGAERILGTVESYSPTVRVHFDGGSVHTTPGHPFLTQRGWVLAGQLNEHDHIVRMVSSSSDEEPQEPFLREVLFREMADVSAGDSGESSQPRGVEQGRGRESWAETSDMFSANAGAQPYGETRECAENERQFARDWTQAEHPGGQRTHTLQHADAFVRHVYGSSLRVRFCDRQGSSYGRVSESLQVGSGVSGAADRDRGGWGQPFRIESTRTGRAQGTAPYTLRLARVTGVEQIHTGILGGYTKVYNLHISGSNTYVAEGCVVHNCHKLKNLESARTRKLRRFMQDYPETVFLPLTGTPLGGGLKGCAHLFQWSLPPALRPLPEPWKELMEWSQALDYSVQEAKRLAPGALTRFCADAEEASSLDGVRSAIGRRFVQTPGVVHTSVSDCDASMSIDAVLVEGYSQATEDAFEQLHEKWITPDGQTFAEASQAWAHQHELAGGFYYKWDPPAPRPWRDARREWHSQAREIILTNRRNIDSELMVANAIDRGEYDGEALAAWRAIRKSFTPNPQAVWIDTAMLNACTGWLRDHTGIVWVQHVAMGERLAEYTGLPYYGAGGVDATGASIEKHARGSLIASIESNKEGRNLQRFDDNLLTYWPATAMFTEQLMGRTHRTHQMSDHVSFTVLIGCRVQYMNYMKARAKARIELQKAQMQQKILLADDLVPHETLLSQRGPRWAKTRKNPNKDTEDNE